MKAIIIRGDSKCCSVCGREDITKLAEIYVNDRSWIDFVNDDGNIVSLDEMETAECPICGTQPIMEKYDFQHERVAHWLFSMETGQTWSFTLQAIIDIVNDETRLDRLDGEEYTWQNVHKYWQKDNNAIKWKYWKSEILSNNKADERGER